MINYIKNLFSANNTAASPSKTVKEELLKRIHEFEKGKCTIEESIFLAIIIFPLNSFEFHSIAKDKQKEALYRSNGVYFELACYLFIRLDSYLFYRHPEFRKMITEYLLKNITELFCKLSTYPEDEFKIISSERFEMYGKMIREKKDVGYFYTLISSAIHDTIQNGKPRLGVEHIFEPICIFDYYLVTKELQRFELNLINTTYGTIDKTIDHICLSIKNINK